MNNSSEEDLKNLEAKIDCCFRNKKLLYLAMTHSSYANEAKLGRMGCNERLEFLGDAVLELVTSEYLYRTYPDLDEGALTKKRASLVCEPSLAYCARQFGLPAFLILGKGEEHTGGRNRDSVVSDACEALIGAIYLDRGFRKAKEFVMKYILHDAGNLALFIDSKTILQEIVQEQGDAVSYRLTGETGPEHNKEFQAEVWLHGQLMGTGTGHNKKSAEQAAAYEAVKQLRGKNR